MHRLLAAAILILGVAAFIPGYRLHRRQALLAPILTGIVLIVAVACVGETLPGIVELAGSVTGSVLLVSAHLLNRSFCKQCRTCSEAEGACATTDFR